MTVTTDPAGKWKAMSTDINGNLRSVLEPDPSAPGGPAAAPATIPACAAGPTFASGMVGTYYTYDAFKNLTRVDMWRNGYDQVRTFTYQNATNWLMSATNPENGTVTYTRDPQGKVLTRTDARGQVTTYTYDDYSRLTSVTRGNDPCQTENYYYDRTTFDGYSTGASWGKLTAVSFANPGNGACPGVQGWGGLAYEYSYSSAGRTTGKRMVIKRSPSWGAAQTLNLDAGWGYDNEGRVTGVTYPTAIDQWPNTISYANSYSYSYDSMGRPIQLNVTGPWTTTAASQISQYNANDQIVSWFHGGQFIPNDFINPLITETRTYNSMYQLTNISDTWETDNWTPHSLSETYQYSANQNNGQITGMTEKNGEVVSYQYDALKRLIQATSSAWGTQTYSYDGFGNMTSKSGSFTMNVDPATNRLLGLPAGWYYDANGNLYEGNWNYDVENRLAYVDASGGEYYAYDPSNKRVFKGQTNDSNGTYFFYGVDGKVMAEYTLDWFCDPNVSACWTGSQTLAMDRVTESAYLAGHKVLPTGVRDRLGSMRDDGHYSNKPYGENFTGGNADGFATYYQDSSTQLHYADQRYYAATYGRFNTPDRYKASAGPSDPGSWNRYAYVASDPVNFGDMAGTEKASPDDSQYASTVPDFSTTVYGFSYGSSLGVPLFPSALSVNPSTLAQWWQGLSVRYWADQIKQANTAVNSARKAAEKALQNPDCARHFGTAGTRSGAWDPVKALDTVYSSDGGYIGGSNVYVGYSVSLPLVNAAQIGPAVFVGGNTGGIAAGIRVDIDPEDFNFFSTLGSTGADFQAATLLHELGHIYWATSAAGSGGSDIAYDALGSAPGQSQKNQEMILKDCFGYKN
jgi:RHS repeat-associated protein